MNDEFTTESVIFDNIKHKFTTHQIDDMSDNGKIYPKTIVYRENTINIGVDLILKFADLSKDAIRVLDWVGRNLGYNKNRIFISPTDLGRYYNSDRKNISKGIRQLMKENILIRANSINDMYKSLPDSCYIVNIDYMMRGNNKQMRDLLKVADDRIARYENSLKLKELEPNKLFTNMDGEPIPIYPQ